MSIECTTKRCSKCGIEQSIDEYWHDKTKSDGHRPECRSCCKYYQDKYRTDHRDIVLRRKHLYRECNRDVLRSKQRQYYRSHRQDVEFIHSERKRLSAWKRTNRPKATVWAHRRRARKLTAGGTHNATDIQRQGAVQKWRCWWCGEDCKDSYHIDHMVPLSRGGHNGPGNIVIACPHCNLSKHDKLPHEWCGKLL